MTMYVVSQDDNRILEEIEQHDDDLENELNLQAAADRYGISVYAIFGEHGGIEAKASGKMSCNFYCPAKSKTEAMMKMANGEEVFDVDDSGDVFRFKLVGREAFFVVIEDEPGWYKVTRED